jgi:serine/threonine protein kinase
MTDRVGQQLGNYRITRLLGHGGFADVYLGEHIFLKTPAAVKVLQARLSLHDDLNSFLQEAQTVARLIHPNIVRVLDFGVHEETPYLVMDYAPGGTLRQRHPKDSQLSITTIVPYVKQLAEALHYAHSEKFIHRDIKPENMLIGRRGEILLSDFGIALISQSSRYQGTQDVTGTVAYMAPEQIQGKPVRASDQYALGITVYEWLSGDRPFHGSFTELCVQHMFAPTPPLREKLPTISPEVEQVVMTALAKDAKQRFGSVQAFANALEQASGQASKARPRSVPAPLTQSSSELLTSPSSPPSKPLIPPQGVVTPSTHAPLPAQVPPTQTMTDPPVVAPQLEAKSSSAATAPDTTGGSSPKAPEIKPAAAKPQGADPQFLADAAMAAILREVQEQERKAKLAQQGAAAPKPSTTKPTVSQASATPKPPDVKPTVLQASATPKPPDVKPTVSQASATPKPPDVKPTVLQATASPRVPDIKPPVPQAAASSKAINIWKIGWVQIISIIIGTVIDLVLSRSFISLSPGYGISVYIIVPLFFAALFGPWTGMFIALLGYVVGHYIFNPSSPLFWQFFIGDSAIGFIAGLAFARTHGRYPTFGAAIYATILGILGLIAGITFNLFTFIPSLAMQYLPRDILYNGIYCLILLPILLLIYDRIAHRKKPT